MTKVLATPAAKRIAKEKKIDLINIIPSSKDGIIRQKDVVGFNLVFTQKVSPLALKIAKIHKVDLTDAKGSGHNGKVMKADVLGLMHQPAEPTAATTATEPKPVAAKATEQPALQRPQTVAKAEGEGIRREKMSPMRKVIARRMSESYFQVPAVYINNEVDMSKLLELRKTIIPTIEEETGYRVSVGDMITMAVVKSLMKHPTVNASIDAENSEIIYHDYVHMAIAVGLENGLLTPVIRNVDTMSLKQYVVASKPVLKEASQGKVTPEQLEGSTFTISNLGMFDVDSFTPIINQPNAAILGVNAAKEKVVAINGEMVIRPMMTLSLTIDHRVIDGMEGANFLQTLKGYIESPLSLLL